LKYLSYGLNLIACVKHGGIIEETTFFLKQLSLQSTFSQKYCIIYVMKEKIKKRLKCSHLDVIAIPGVFMNKKKNALYHLKHICPKCPKWRRKMRDVEKNGTCWWHENWKKSNYGIHRHFGVKNFITQYTHLKTDLRKHRMRLKKESA